MNKNLFKLNRHFIYKPNKNVAGTEPLESAYLVLVVKAAFRFAKKIVPVESDIAF